MNTYFYFEGNIYETEEEVVRATKNYNSKRFDKIETEASFDLFEGTFEDAKESGCSDADALELAKYSM